MNFVLAKRTKYKGLTSRDRHRQTFQAAAKVLKPVSTAVKVLEPVSASAEFNKTKDDQSESSQSQGQVGAGAVFQVCSFR